MCRICSGEHEDWAGFDEESGLYTAVRYDGHGNNLEISAEVAEGHLLVVATDPPAAQVDLRFPVESAEGLAAAIMEAARIAKG